MSKKLDHSCLFRSSGLLILFLVSCLFCVSNGADLASLVVKRNEREPIVSTEFGEISRVRLSDGNQTFQLHFFTLEPNSLLLPVLLHQDMVFFVHTGVGVISYLDVDEDKRETRNLKQGDVHRLRVGSVFYLQSDLDDPEREKLRLHAIFGTSGPDFNEAAFEPYSSIRDLVLGFDKQVLQQIFEVPEEVIEEMTSGKKPPAIIQAIPRKEKTMWEKEQEYLTDVLSGNLFHFRNKKEKKSKVYNIFSEKPDFENCNGWSTTVNRKKYSPLRHSQFGIFMVNLTTGSMMGPHWNPMATEIAVVVQGKGMVHVVCSSGLADTECKNMRRINVEEGDAFVVPRYHPMGHMAFNNETFVFVGFSTSTKKNHPQFLAGQASVLRTLDKQIVARSLGVSNETLDRLLVNQGESVILKCTSCAEEEWRLMQEEIKKEREEEREREQEEARRKEEEQRRRREEEEEKKLEEEEAQQKREEQEREEKEREEAKRKEEEQKRQEEERRKQEEEEAKEQEEEAERQRREEQEREEAKRKEEEERRQEEEGRRQEEEEAKEQEEEAARQEREEREREKAAKRKEEEQRGQEAEREEAKRKEEEQRGQEEERQKQEEEEAARQEREEKEREASRQQEQEAREREEAARREREKQQAEERERQRQQEEREAQEKEEAAIKEREEEKERQARQREEEATQKRREEEQEQAEREARQRAQEQEQAQKQKEKREAEAKSEEEAARREEEEAEREEQPRKREQQEEEGKQEEQGSRGEGQQETEEEHRGGGTGMRRTV